MFDRAVHPIDEALESEGGSDGRNWRLVWP